LQHASLTNMQKIAIFHRYLHPEMEVIASEGQLFSATMRLHKRSKPVSIFNTHDVLFSLHGHWYFQKACWPGNSCSRRIMEGINYFNSTSLIVFFNYKPLLPVDVSDTSMA